MKTLVGASVVVLLAACGNGGHSSGACISSADCPSGTMCCASAGNTCTIASSCPAANCSRPVVPTAFPDSSVLLHSTFKVGDTATFTVPADAGSVSILQQSQRSTLQVQVNGSTYENSAVPLTITGPGGQTIFDVNANTQSFPDGGGVDPATMYSFFGGDQASTATFTIPNTTASLDAGVPAGSWQMTVSDYAYQCTFQRCTSGASNAGTYDVTVLARPAPVSGEAAKLDVNVYIVANKQNSSNALFSSAGPYDSSVSRFKATYQALLQRAGIAASVTFRDVTDADRSRFGTNIYADLTGPCDELDQMFLLSGTSPGNTVNLFLVTSINPGSSSGGGGIVVGIDGSIPGPSTLNGTVRSGAVVSLADLYAGTAAACSGAINLPGCGADNVAYIAAHETGHFLGLFHTTEMAGSDFDPVADTGKCPCLPCASPSRRSSCSSRNGALVFPADCTVSTACSGGDNLMFWQFDPPISTGQLSPQQSAIMRLNPAVHP